MRHILIGDIHGCYEELRDLLDLVAPAADDRTIAIGDIVDRGPDRGRIDRDAYQGYAAEYAKKSVL